MVVNRQDLKSKLDHRVLKGSCESWLEVVLVKFFNLPTSTICYLHYCLWLVVVQVNGSTAGWSLVAVTILLPDVVVLVVVVVVGTGGARPPHGCKAGVGFRAVTLAFPKGLGVNAKLDNWAAFSNVST